MITKKELVKAGYAVLPKGGWLRLDPTIIPHDWHDLCGDFGIDPDCEEIVLCIAGVKEINKEEVNV